MKKFDKKNIEDILALTPMQEGMLFHYIKEPQSHQYFGQLNLGLSGEIDIQCFEKAWNFVIETNEMLRTLFNWEKVKKPVQIILKEYRLKIKYVDFSGMETKEEEKLLEETKNRDRKEKFDLQDIAFRVTLSKLGKERYEMIVSNHHILYDGWSNGIILKEFFSAYHDLILNKIAVKPLKNKFKLYVEWLRDQDLKDWEKYWNVYLAGFDEKTGVPYKIKNNRGKIDAGNVRKIFAKELKKRLEEFVKRNRVTMAVIFYLAWGILLQKYNNCEDVVFGTTVSGRPAKIKGIEDMVGLFINTLPLRLNFQSNVKIIESLNKINKNLKDREKYESTSLVEIKNCTELDNREELFDSILIVENYPLDRRIADGKSGLSINSYDITETTNYPLTIGITVSEKIEVSISYDGDFFDQSSVFKIFNRFCAIINDIVQYPGKEISSIEIISKEEKEQILYEFNNTAMDYPEDKTIHQLFEEQAERTGDRVVVIGMGHAITYGELNKKSDQLAYLLKEKGVKPDTIVGIMTEPSVQMVIGIFGILKSGGAYLPIDPDCPEERIKYMLADSAAKILLTSSDYIPGGAGKQGGLAPLYLSKTLRAPCSMLHASQTGSSSLAYIIYTSGTTGRPKGVLVEHRNAVNTILCRKEEYKMAQDDCSLQLFSYTFDGFVTSFFTPVISGARVLLLDKKGRKDISRIKEAIVFGGVTHFISVPALFQALLDTFGPGEAASLKVVTLAGDRLPLSLLENACAREGNIEIAHEYGVTEAAVMSTICRHQQKKEEITIGKPVWNTSIYILNKHMQLQPKGAAGELYIAGKGAARGYLNNPELTVKKFVDHSSNKFIIHRTNSSLLYRTGDLARWLPDGNIEFLGRIDHQVKIRGFRIESEEIENRLSDHPGVKEAVVLAREKESGEKYLCAYIVARSMEHGAWSAGELREYLSQTLPGYMIPSHFVAVEKIPLTANGKIERKALPEPEVEQGDTYAAPRDHLERKLVEIWSEVLEVEPANIGIDDDFFSLGGHSLKATGLISKIHKEMNVKVPVDTLFEIPFIKALAGYVKEAKQDLYVSIPKAEKKEYYPVSSAQKRMFLLNRLKGDDISDNSPGAMCLEGCVNKQYIEEVLQELIKRHEILRTSFELRDMNPVQVVHKDVEFRINYYDPDEPPASLIDNFVRPFDLSQAPLLRVDLVKISQEQYMLMYDMHHIITDDTSSAIFLNDFVDLYRGGELAEPAVQYKDFACWQNDLLQSERVKKQEEYWVGVFQSGVPVLNLPTDFPRPPVQSFEGRYIRFRFSNDLTKRLDRMALENNATLYMVLLAIYNVLLARYSGQEDIVVGTPIAGRVHTDLQNIMGFFINTLAMHHFPKGEKTFGEFLEEVKSNSLKAFENQDYQFDQLIDRLGIEQNPGRQKMFDTMFVMQNVDINLESLLGEIKDVTFRPYEFQKQATQFDILLHAFESDTEISFRLDYCTKLFKEETMVRLMHHVENIAEEVTADPLLKISEIKVFSENEKAGLSFQSSREKLDHIEVDFNF